VVENLDSCINPLLPSFLAHLFLIACRQPKDRGNCIFHKYTILFEYGNVPEFGVRIGNIRVKGWTGICSASGSLALVSSNNKRMNMRAIASMKMVVMIFDARFHSH